MAKDKKKKKKSSPKGGLLGKVLAGARIVSDAAAMASLASLKVSPLATFGWTFVEQIYEAVRDLPAADRPRLREQVQKMTDEALAAELETLGKSQREGVEVLANLTRSVIDELTSIRAELPPYDELLVRLDAMGTAQRYQLDDFLTRLPLALNDCLTSQVAVALANKQRDDAKEFEGRYFKKLTKRYRYVDTIGVRDRAGFKLELQTAYVTLNLQRIGLRSGSGRAERVILDNPLLTIRGPAGSGKTTLLHWMELACAAGDSDDGPFRGFVPFFVPLRSCQKTGKVNLAKLIEYTFPRDDWPKTPPDNWIIDVLESKRAILLIDGVDELPASKRPAFWTWLDGFLDDYAGNRVVVTSRPFPGSSSDDEPEDRRYWQPPAEFRQADVLELTDDDIRTLIDKWHQAVLEGQPDMSEDDRRRLESARRKLPQSLFEPSNSRVRELCSTPLLCSLVCALFWREDGYLPSRRNDLYDRCCQMLIDERDAKRDIPVEPPFCYLSRPEKQNALQQLAYAMMLSADADAEGEFRLEVSRAQAKRFISPAIKAFDHPDARKCKADDLIGHLITRTGLLRAPAEGRIDFPHRTFQEYLAACEAGNQDQYQFLASNAANDAWRETIILAAGTPLGGAHFGRDLIDALIKKGDKHTSQKAASRLVRRKCYALAVACLDTLQSKTAEQRDEVLKRLKKVVPPRNFDEARALAAAGEAVVSHLRYNACHKYGQRTRAACVRTLNLIGSQTAHQTIARGYYNDKADSVMIEVCDIPGLDPLTVPSVQARVRNMYRLLPEAVAAQIESLAAIAGFRDSIVLNLIGCKRVTDLGPLSQMAQVRYLVLASCTGITDLGALREMSQLENLWLNDCTGITDLRPLGGMTNLDLLALTNCTGITDLGPLRGMSRLRRLWLTNCAGITDLGPLVQCESLREITAFASGVTDLPEELRSKVTM